MPSPSDFLVLTCQSAATIASGQTASSAVDLAGTALVGISLPAAFTGTALTFSAALTVDGTYQSVRDGAGNAISKTVAQGQYIPIDPALFHGVRFLKVTSGSAEGADRVVTLVSKAL